jgi:N-acetylneuraminate synthase
VLPASVSPPHRLRETPWGQLTYLEYRQRLELGHADYDEIDNLCRKLKLAWFASVWDEPSVDFIAYYNPPYFKIPSAQLVNHSLLRKVCRTGVPLIMSTGMSTDYEIGDAMRVLTEEHAKERVTLLHAVSAYPCKNDVNLNAMKWLATMYGVPVGYSGHELGLQITVAAVALGAVMVERHITINRAMWGTDQAASLEPHGLDTLVRDIHIFQEALRTKARVPLRRTAAASGAKWARRARARSPLLECLAPLARTRSNIHKGSPHRKIVPAPIAERGTRSH